jgi:hypothetical protein
LEQTIITNTYTKSHIDLLYEEASPFSPNSREEGADMVLDPGTAIPGNETRDGGQTPGPFEEIRRRMAAMGTSPLPPSAGGIRKRKKKGNRRRWVWTIGQEEEAAEVAATETAGPKPAEIVPRAVPVLALPAPRPRTRATAMADKEPPRLVISALSALPQTPSQFAPLTAIPLTVEPPTPSVESSVSHDTVFDTSGDVEMSDDSSFLSETDYTIPTPSDKDMDTDIDMITPVAATPPSDPSGSKFARLSSVHIIEPRRVSRDSPIPPELTET